MDVAGLYTNIDHDEGAQACFAKLESRKKQKNTINVIDITHSDSIEIKCI